MEVELLGRRDTTQKSEAKPLWSRRLVVVKVPLRRMNWSSWSEPLLKAQWKAGGRQSGDWDPEQTAQLTTSWTTGDTIKLLGSGPDLW